MQRRKRPWTSLVFLFFVVFFIWVLLQFLAPLALPAGSVSDLSGVVGVADRDDKTQTMPFPWNVVYFSGDLLCHQKPERSLFLNGNQMPFCTRCTAIWVGVTVGLGFMMIYTIKLSTKFAIAMILSLVPLGVDGIGQLFGFWESTNVLRVLTGFPAGLICGIALGIIFDELQSLSFFGRLNVFQKPKP
jgi:uncharacterized membrane protein